MQCEKYSLSVNNKITAEPEDNKDIVLNDVSKFGFSCSLSIVRILQAAALT